MIIDPHVRQEFTGTVSVHTKRCLASHIRPVIGVAKEALLATPEWGT